VPHFVKGVTGERHMTPFGKPSSAPVNVLWGGANFYFASLLWHWAMGRTHTFLLSSVAVLIGVMLIGIVLAINWQHDDKAKGK
jgi:hypothetical protein